MSTAAADRYVTSDFRTTPIIALADLMGLRQFQGQIELSSEVLTPILNGICVYRHLESPERQKILKSIREDVPPSHLQARLMGLVTGQIVQPLWYMWSLSDEELLEFFHFSNTKAEITSTMSVASLPDFSVGAIATALVAISFKGPRAAIKAQAREQIEALVKRSELVKEIGQRLGFKGRALSALGLAAVPTIIVVSGLNIMAKAESSAAKRELAARGLLAYRDL